jgi:hypothetical protein
MMAGAETPSPKYSIIYSFRDRDQQVWPEAVWEGPESPTEEGLVRFALQGFTPEEAGSLTKLSVCQTGGAIPKWLLARGGKFYFNPDVNPDADTRRWAEFARSLALGVDA